MVFSDAPLSPHRIGIDARFLRRATGGIGRYTRELITRLPQVSQHHFTVFITPSDEAEFDALALPMEKVVVDAPHFSRHEQTRLPRALTEAKLDLVHFLNPSVPLLYRKPFVVTLHDLTLLKFAGRDGSQKRVKREVYRRVLKYAFGKAVRVLSVSEYSARDAEREFHLNPTKFEIIYEGAPVAQQPAFGSKARLQEVLGTRDPYILFLSQWRPHKGIGTIIEAFSQFKRRTGASHKLVLVGNKDGAARSVTDAIARSGVASDIITPGFIDEELLPALYSYASLFVMPSEYEGFGLPVLEAMRYGTPSLIADASSLPEVGGSVSHYAPSRDSKAWAQQIERLLSDDALRTASLSNAEAHLAQFSWDTMAARTAAVYDSVLAKRA